MTDNTEVTNEVVFSENESNPAEFVVPQQVEDAAKAEAAKAAKVDEPKEPVKEEAAQEEDPAKRAAAREAFFARRAKKQADDAIARVAQLEQELAASKAAPRQNAADDAVKAPTRPKADDFELGRWDPKYEEAKAKYDEDFETYIAQKAEKTARDATMQHTESARQQVEMASLAATADSVGKRGVDKYNDFEEVVQNALEAMPPSPQALQRLVKLENAEDVFYHLGQHPELLEKITAMEPMDQTLEFGKISARLASSAKVAAKVTKAQPTPEQPRGGNGQFTKEADARYEKMLKAQNNVW